MYKLFLAALFYTGLMTNINAASQYIPLENTEAHKTASNKFEPQKRTREQAFDKYTTNKKQRGSKKAENVPLRRQPSSTH